MGGLQMLTSALTFWYKILRTFTKFMVCPHGKGRGGWASADKGRGQFFTILCGHLLRTAPNHVCRKIDYIEHQKTFTYGTLHCKKRFLMKMCKESSIKNVRTKSQKIDPSLLVHKIYALAQPPPPCPCGHTINFENLEVFCTKKCGRPLVRKISGLDKLPSPLTANIFYGRPLMFR